MNFRKKDKKEKKAPRKPLPYAETHKGQHHGHAGHEGHESHASHSGHSGHPSHSSHDQKAVNSKHLDDAFALSHKIHEQLKVLSKHEHHSHHDSFVHPALVHANICETLLEEIQPTHNTPQHHVNPKKLHDAVNQAGALHATLKKVDSREADIPGVLGESERLYEILKSL